jgi:iron complex transport system ATP-binding protein
MSETSTPTSYPPDETLLRAESVQFGHRGSIFLSVPELNVRRGRLLGLLGPNGAGKSTLLRLLAGLATPQAGVVYICGHRVDKTPVERRARCIAWVPQRAETPFEWTVWEMVSIGRHPYQASRLRDRESDREVVVRALEQVGLAGFRHRSVSTLSGGEWQRALIARALAQEPRVLLLDEPVANLDLAYQRQIYELIRSLCSERGLAVVAADHHIDLQGRFCDELMLLDHGKVAAQGAVEEVLTTGILESVFRTPLRVERDPATGRPTVRWRFEER